MKILLILFLTSVVVFAGKPSDEEIISYMENRCKFLEKERTSKKYEVDIVPDSSSAVAMALDIAYSKYNARPAVKTRVKVSLIGENKEYWFVNFNSLIRGNNKYVHVIALISKNNGTFLCDISIRATD